MCKYQKVRGARAVLGIIAIAALVLILSGCNASQSTAQSNQNASVLSDAPAPSASFSSQPETSNPESIEALTFNDTLPFVADHSYWRLSRQGKARIIPDTEESLNLAATLFDTHELLANYPEIDVKDLINSGKNGRHTFGIASTKAYPLSPGTIISRIHNESSEITISVPMLSDELTEYAAERGESYYMIHTRAIDGSEESAELISYQGCTYLDVFASEEYPEAGAAPYVTPLLANWKISSYVTKESTEFPIWRGDIISIRCHVPDCECNSKFHIIYDEAGGKRALETSPDEYLEGFSISDQMATFTETTYTPSPAQMELLREMMFEFESQPLPDSILN